MQPIQHLAQLLHDHVHISSASPPSQTVIDGFFQSITTDRIRFNHHDWQGHPVTTLLWHMPNLRPEKKTALVRFIVHQWSDYNDNTASTKTDTGAHTDTAGRPAVMIDPVEVAPPPPSQSQQPNASAPPPNHFLTTLPVPHRDWFDCFTDWVVAVISLFD